MVSFPRNLAVRLMDVVKEFTVGTQRIRAIDRLSLEIPSGQFIAIVGRSGSGKSTLLNLLAGIDTPTSGQVWVGERKLSRMTDDDLTRQRRDHIGMVYQFFNLLSTLSVRENVALPALLAGEPEDEALARADALLEEVSLSHRRDARPHTLSGGEMQRTALARALIHSPMLVLADFADTVDAVAGKANLQVASDSEGFDERIYPRIRAVPGVKAAAPVIQVYALARPGPPAGKSVYISEERGPYNETLLVLGIDLFSEAPFARYEPPRRGDRTATLDFLSDPRAVAITRTLANRHRLKLGDVLTILSAGQPVILTVRQILDSQELQQAMGGNVVIIDIAVAQEVFHRSGKLDRIDLLVDPDRKDAVKAAIQALLPPQAEVIQPQGRTQQVENLVSAFRLSLTALSFIALFVSIFLIFNAVSMSVLRRRREIGILRSIGVTRRQVMLQFLSEAIVLGVVGSLVGLGTGTLLAKVTLGSISRTLTDLYLVVHASNLSLDPLTYILGFALGVGMSLLSALAPAVEATRTLPSVTVRQGILIEAMPLPIGRWTVAGVGVVALASAVAVWTVSQRRPMGGFASAFLLLVGFSLLAPGCTLLCESLAGSLMRLVAGIEGMLGARYLREAVARTSVVVAMLGVISTLTAIILQRGREIGRHIGPSGGITQDTCPVAPVPSAMN